LGAFIARKVIFVPNKPTMSSTKPAQPQTTDQEGEQGKTEVQPGEPNIQKPLKNPLLNRNKKERKYFDSADWAMGQEKKG